MAGNGAEMKNNIQKRFVITMVILLATLVSCLPMNDEQIYAKAEEISANLSKPVEEDEGVNVASEKRNLADDQQLRLSGRFINNLDPMAAVYYDWFTSNQVYIGLTRYDSESEEFKPAMAKSWDVSKDLKTWTFKLQEELPWVTYNEDTDAVEEVRDENDEVRYVTAQDIKNGLMRALDPYTFNTTKYYLNTIVDAADYSLGESSAEDVGIETPSEYELVIHLNQPNPYLDALVELPIFSAYPSWMLDEPDGTAFEIFYPYGYGPYVIKEYLREDIDDDHILLVKNPFWKETEGLVEPVLEEISYDLNPDQDVVKLYQTGALDAVQLTFDEYKAIKDDAAFTDALQITPGSCGYYLFFNQIEFGFPSKKATREMIAAAIDKDELNEELFLGTVEVLNQYVPALVRGSQPEDESIGIPYDIEEAEGYFDDLNQAGQKAASLNFFTIDLDMNNALADRIVDQLVDAQVPVDLQVMGWPEYFERIASGVGIGDIFLTQLCVDYYDAQTLWDAWVAGDITTQSVTWQQIGFLEHLNKGLQKEKTSDRAEEYAKLEEIILQEDVVAIPLIWGSNYWLVRPSIDAEILPFYQQLESWAVVE